MDQKHELPSDVKQQLLDKLKDRFEQNRHRHSTIEWAGVLAKLEALPSKLWSLNEMEISGGEPDVVGVNAAGEYSFFDCSPETPKGRRSICYDQEALDSRKEHKPHNSAIGMADAMGIEILSEVQYRELQQLGKFDTKTSSWIKTPPAIRELDGALFGDFRYGNVFIYHNGASSYYAVRGFRGVLYV